MCSVAFSFHFTKCIEIFNKYKFIFFKRYRTTPYLLKLGQGWEKTEPEATDALTFSPPTFSPSDNSAHTVSPSENWTLNFLTNIFLVPVSFSPQILCPPLGVGGLIVTCDIKSTPLDMNCDS
jgi:hypothetical protein